MLANLPGLLSTVSAEDLVFERVAANLEFDVQGEKAVQAGGGEGLDGIEVESDLCHHCRSGEVRKAGLGELHPGASGKEAVGR